MTAKLETGTYHWRVRGEAGDGVLADWSPVARMEVVESPDDYVESLLEEEPLGGGGPLPSAGVLPGDQ